MSEHQTSRTLLKSPPELWAECSDAGSLAKHLGETVGEIRITRLEPDSTVAWEGDRASGTVRLEPSGWGTRVTLTCSRRGAEEVPPDPPPAAEPEAGRPAGPVPEPARPEPEAQPASRIAEPPAAAPRGRLFARVMRFLAPERAAVEPVAPGSKSERAAPGPVAPGSKSERAAPGPVAPGSEPQRAPEPVAPEPREAEPPPPAEAPTERSGPTGERAAAKRAEAQPPDESESADVLAAALDSLGQAHHRPFSRA